MEFKEIEALLVNPKDIIKLNVKGMCALCKGCKAVKPSKPKYKPIQCKEFQFKKNIKIKEKEDD